MGLKSFLFERSGAAKRLRAEVERLQAVNRDLKSRVAALKARPPRRPLDSVPEHEQALRTALAELAAAKAWEGRVQGWPALAQRVSTAVSACDIMLVKATARAYVGTGLSALACVQQALAGAGTPEFILDFGCGYGRVLRFLRAAYPDAALYHTDMDAEGLGFCTHHFNGFGFRTDLEHGLQWVPARFDLIWVGSVFTHLDVPDCERLLRHLAAFLRPGGLVVFTTHGDSAAERMAAHKEIYRLEPALLDRILADRERAGHGYADYPGTTGYGVSAMTTAWVERLIVDCGLTRHLHLPAGWAGHQDVFAARSAGAA